MSKKSKPEDWEHPRLLFPQYYALNPDHSTRRLEGDAALTEWARSFERQDRHVAFNAFGHEAIGTVHVSTVFLGVDHRWFDEGDPLIFETMIFAPDGGEGGLDGYTDRTSTWDQALIAHARAVQLVKEAFTELQKASGA